MTNAASRIDPRTPSSESGASAATQSGERGDGASQNFLAMLLAGLGWEPQDQAAAGEPLTGTSDEGSRPRSSRMDGPPVKEKPKEQINDGAFGVPVAVAMPPAGLPRIAAYIGIDSGACRDSGTSANNGTIASAAGCTAASGSLPTPAQGGSEASGSDAKGTSLLANAQGPLPALGETAFEAHIQIPDLPTSDTPNQSARQTAVPMGANPPATRPRTIAGNTTTSQTPPTGHDDTANGEPVKPSPEEGAGPFDAKVPSAGLTSHDSGGQAEQDPAGLKQDSGEPARKFPEASPGTVEPSLSAATVSTGTVAGGSESAVPSRAEAAATIAPAASEDVVPAPVAGTPARDIAIQLQDPGGPRVDVQLVDRAGTVHVIVRTQDDGLARDLRSNLPDLAQKLNQQGLEADAWSPVEMHNTAGGHENPGHSREQTAEDSHSSAGGQDSGRGERDRRQGQSADPDDEFHRNFSGF
ncbi:MAG: hypothetical protein ABSG53_33260, partial [Thermoguttaceae bacterium]